MRYVNAAEADGQLAEILRIAEEGETVIILRDGEPVAHLTPDNKRQRGFRKEVMADLMSRRSRWGLTPMTTQEILDLRHEGHRF